MKTRRASRSMLVTIPLFLLVSLAGCVEEDALTPDDLAGTPDVLNLGGEPIAVAGACGDDEIDAGELCDGSDLGGVGCGDVDAAYVGGTLGCNLTCNGYDTSACLVQGEGNACVYNSHCGASAPACVNGACSVGDEGDAC
ncbi:MAG: hypothetical protein KC457_26250, partial [Myxococcales bacterium]|nr:hypothetical protein [Myxococcales bacterium]